MRGQVVRGIAGRRSEYRPVVSTLCATAEPLVVATAFREHFGLRRFYVADLDAFDGSPSSTTIFQQLHIAGFALMVDAGLRNLTQAQTLVDSRVDTVVVGLETIAGPKELVEILQSCGPKQILFSLDLRNGVPLGDRAAWEERPATSILELIVDLGVRRLLLLDLARVGVGTGVGTDELAEQALKRPEKLEVIVGGGVRGTNDLRHFQALGVSGVLVASAFHEGKITAAEIAELRNSGV